MWGMLRAAWRVVSVVRVVGWAWESHPHSVTEELKFRALFLVSSSSANDAAVSG